MPVELGRYGIWLGAGELTDTLAREAERLGFGALWVGRSPRGELAEVEAALEVTESLVLATGIVNVWREEAATVAASYHRIERRHPGRFVLGIGIGHPESTKEYDDPFATLGGYLDGLAAAGVPGERTVLAALGPRVLRLAADRTAGAHPYLTTPRHTRTAREVIGDGPLLAPEQTVVAGMDPSESLRLGRSFVARYLRLVNYRNNLLREGWTESDLADGGSDRLVDELVLTGSAAGIAAGVDAHLEAGADHVTIQDLGPDKSTAYRILAEAVIGK
ncbi:MAG TPA: LLM class F420-dependent oxidoreductase [Acidimicrobiia bacterium]|jgi:probable F420-dependent oxidoreductase